MSRKSFGHKVDHLSTNQLRRKAKDLRRRFSIGVGRLDVIKFLEHNLGEIITWEVWEASRMPGLAGLTDPVTLSIIISDVIYNKAVSNDPMARRVICHEIGHLCLGHEQPIAKTVIDLQLWSNQEDSEWQANYFADSLLMPTEGIQKCKHPREAAELFGVEFNVAHDYWTSLKIDKVI